MRFRGSGKTPWTDRAAASGRVHRQLGRSSDDSQSGRTWIKSFRNTRERLVEDPRILSKCRAWSVPHNLCASRPLNGYLVLDRCNTFSSGAGKRSHSMRPCASKRLQRLPSMPAMRLNIVEFHCMHQLPSGLACTISKERTIVLGTMWSWRLGAKSSRVQGFNHLWSQE